MTPPPTPRLYSPAPSGHQPSSTPVPGVGTRQRCCEEGSTTVQIGCKLWGAYYPESGGDPLPAEVAVWDVRLMAERVGSVIVQ